MPKRKHAEFILSQIYIKRKQRKHGLIAVMKNRLGRIGSLVSVYSVIAGCALLTGCRSPQPVFPEIPAVTIFGSPTFSPDEMMLRPGDLVTLDLAGAPQPFQERIKEDGTLILPSIGASMAAGKTGGELRKELAEKYHLNFSRVPPRQELVYHVSGEVRSPGPKPYVGKTTVSRVIQAAGGFKDFANKKKIRLIHADGSSETVNLGSGIPDSDHDPLVFPDDKITVNRRRFFAR